MTAPPETAAAEPNNAEGRATVQTNLSIEQALLGMMGGIPARAGVNITERNAMTYVAVFAATKILAEAVGMLPIAVYEGDEDGDDSKIALDHPLRRMLRAEPNPWSTATVFKETLQSHLCLWGNAYARIIRDSRDRPVWLAPLEPDPGRTRAERKAGRVKYRLSADNGREEEEDPENILHIPGLGFDGISGLSPIGLMRENLGIPKAAEIYGANFFGQGSNMSGIVSFDGVLTPEQQNAFKANWEAQKVGLQQSGKTVFLDRGAKYSRVGIPPEDAQFIETRKFGVLDVCRIYRIPPHMMADLEKASYASIEQSGLEFLIYSLMPWLEKWEQEIDRKLLGLDSGFFCRFVVRKLLRADTAARQSYYANGRQWGWLSDNDIRREENLPAKVGGDTYLTPVNMVRVGADGKPIDPPPAPAAPAPVPAKPGAAEERGTAVEAIARMYRSSVAARGRNNRRGSGLEQQQRRRDAMFREALDGPVRAHVAELGEKFDDRAMAVIDDFVLSHDAPDDARDLDKAASAEADELLDSVDAALSKPRFRAAAAAPVINVTLPEQPTPPAAQITVNVPEQPPPQVTVNVPPPLPPPAPGRTTKRIERDADGRILRIHEEPE